VVCFNGDLMFKLTPVGSVDGSGKSAAVRSGTITVRPSAPR
jgi:hypothetical protein